VGNLIDRKRRGWNVKREKVSSWWKKDGYHYREEGRGVPSRRGEG